MIIGGKEYVAKKLVDVGAGRGNVSIDDAVKLLSSDLVRLTRMQHFREAFAARVIETSTEVVGD